MLIRVDLPAPFSPSRQSTSPGHGAQADVVVGDDAWERLGDIHELDRGEVVPAVVGDRLARSGIR